MLYVKKKYYFEYQVYYHFIRMNCEVHVVLNLIIAWLLGWGGGTLWKCPFRDRDVVLFMDHKFAYIYFHWISAVLVNIQDGSQIHKFCYQNRIWNGTCTRIVMGPIWKSPAAHLSPFPEWVSHPTPPGHMTH